MFLTWWLLSLCVTVYWVVAILLIVAKAVIPPFDAYTAYGLSQKELKQGGVITRRLAFQLYYSITTILSLICLLFHFLAIPPQAAFFAIQPGIHALGYLVGSSTIQAYFPALHAPFASDPRMESQGFPFALTLFTAHVLRRCFEATSVHRFSLSEQLHYFNFIAGLSFYLVSMFTMSYVDLHQSPQYPNPVIASAVVIFYLFSCFRQYQCHVHLAKIRPVGMNLRSPHRHYRPPTSKVFSHVACPHYFWEFMIFVCLVVLKPNLHTLLMTTFVASNLLQRSTHVRQFYSERFSAAFTPAYSMIPLSFSAMTEVFVEDFAMNLRVDRGGGGGVSRATSSSSSSSSNSVNMISTGINVRKSVSSNLTSGSNTLGEGIL